MGTYTPPPQIIGIREVNAGRTGKQGMDWKRTYTRRFRVLTNDNRVGPAIIRNAPGIYIGFPYYANPLENDWGSFCTEVSVTPDGEDGFQWFVDYQYGPHDATDFPADPTQHPPTLSWSFESYEKVCEEDIDGNAVVNSANDYFDPPVMIDDDRPIMTIVTKETSYDASLAAAFKGALNDSPWWGEAEFCWKCKDISASFEFNSDAPAGYFYTITYQFQFNPDTWIRSILDQGFRELDAKGNQQQININGTQPTSPVLLDGSGNQLAPGDPPVFLEFHVFKETDFSQLNLDPSMLPGYSGSWNTRISNFQSNPGSLNGGPFGPDF